MKRRAGLIIFSLLAGCAADNKTRINTPSPGIGYHNQNTAPWPWVSIVPSERALSLKGVNFEDLSRQLHYDIAFEPHYFQFKDVRVILLDYTILPQDAKKVIQAPQRPGRYFMSAGFYRGSNRPPCKPDFEITASLRTDIAATREAMTFMAREIIEEIHTLHDENALTNGKQFNVNLD
ncbi:MAG: hypothetical protein H0X26_00465 [Alphaproteobacteria bacterium]|nr:hypothetical protein [Alphaproteobacteria bacterium]